MARKETVRPDQYSLFSGDETRSLISVPGAELLATRIRKDRLWPQDGRNPNGAFIDWNTNSDSMVAFDARTLEIHPHSEEKRFSIIAISAPGMSNLTEEHSSQLTTSVTKLRKNGVLYVLEPGGSDADMVWRKSALGDVGLVDRSVVRLPGNYLLWRGRLRREHSHNAIDIIETWKNSDIEWKRTKLHEIAAQVSQRYKDSNYKVISWKNIESRLHASKNVKADYDALSAGYGVTIEATCGCQWDVDLHGDKTRTLECGTSDCDGISPLPDKPSSGNPNKKHMYGHDVTLESICSNCKSHLIEDSREIGELPNGRLNILVEVRCPHHGLISGFAKKKSINKKQFIH